MRGDDDLWMGLLTGTCFYLSLTIAEIVKSHLSKIEFFPKKGNFDFPKEVGISIIIFRFRDGSGNVSKE